MDLLFFTHLLNALLMVGMPIALALYLLRRFNISARLWWIGAATFVISQVGHIPFNSWLTGLFQSGVLPAPPASWIPYFNPVVLGLSAGLFEELSRTAVYAWWAKDARSWRMAVLMGAGHGGAEAILLGVLAIYAFLQLSALRNSDLSGFVQPDQLAATQAQFNAYWSIPVPVSLLGAVERFFTIPVQITLSVIVLQAFIRRQPLWVVLAILWHAAIDGVTVYLGGIWAGQAWGSYAIEGVVGITALISLGILFILHTPEPEPEPEDPATETKPIQLEQIKPVKIEDEIKPEALDNSRFSR